MAGHPCEETPGQPPSRSRVVPAPDGAGSIPAGSWISLNAAVGESCRAGARSIPRGVGSGWRCLCCRASGRGVAAPSGARLAGPAASWGGSLRATLIGGPLSAPRCSLPAGGRVSRARRLAEVDGELAAALCVRRLEARLAPPAVPGEATAARRRKLRRMALVRQQEDAGGGRTPQLSVRRGGTGDGDAAVALGLRSPPSRQGWQEQRARHLRDLQIIDAYRERVKGESISRMLSQAITATRTVHAVLGTAEFFEFALKNPYGVQHTVTIEVDHPELRWGPKWGLPHVPGEMPGWHRLPTSPHQHLCRSLPQRHTGPEGVAPLQGADQERYAGGGGDVPPP